MAAIESKRSVPLAQLNAGKKRSAINPQYSASQQARKSRPRSPGRNQPKRRTRSRRLPTLLKPIITKRGKTTIRRYDGRRFYRFDEIKGKTVEHVELFFCAEYHSIDVRFDDMTSLHFVVEPGFTLEAEHSDLKSDNWRSIKKWPLMHSQSHRRSS